MSASALPPHRAARPAVGCTTPGLSEVAWRLGIFPGVLAALEAVLRGPNPSPQRRRRWPGNLGLVRLDTTLARVLLPTGVCGVALWAQPRGFGALNCGRDQRLEALWGKPQA